MKQRLTILIDKWLDGTIQPAEQKELTALLRSPEYRGQVEHLMDQELLQGLYSLTPESEVSENIRQHLMNTIYSFEAPVLQARTAKRISFQKRLAWVAASLIVVVGIGVYFWTTNRNTIQSPTTAIITEEIQPGKEGAILTLADGRQVVLDSLGNGIIAQQNGSAVLIKNGELAYDVKDKFQAEVVYNTMHTPKGRQFNLLLPDGTRVWLNAASSIRYPTVFRGKERVVQLTGEAYFEVAPQKQMPFQVNVNNKVTVEVLGTHFNINAYENESTINTTLLEGSVKVGSIGSQQKYTLTPGQQSQSTTSGISSVKIIPNADINQVMAWKNGFFNFENASLREILRQLERWYDIEVIYEKGAPDLQLSGKITKDIPLAILLRELKEMGLQYKMKARQLIISSGQQ